MERRIFLMGLLLMIAAAGFRCKKSNAPGFWTGKLVVSAACDHFIVQLRSGPVPDSAVLTKSWTNTATDSSYTNVFGVSDLCTFASAGLNVGDVFSFTLNGPVPAQNCYTCLVLPFGMPATSNSVTNIKLVTIN